MKSRILIVNGASNELAAAATALRMAGYEVILAAGAQQALAAVSGKVPDLILVDLSGPDPGGSGLMALLKPDPRLRDIPVVALGPAASPFDTELSPDPGYSGYIAQPIDNEQFARQVAAYMRSTPSAQTYLIADDHPGHAQV